MSFPFNSPYSSLIFCCFLSSLFSNPFAAATMRYASQSAERVFRLLLCPASISTLQASAFSSSKRRNRLARPSSGASGMSAFSTSGDSDARRRHSLFAPGCARTENTVAIAFSPKPCPQRKSAIRHAFHRKDLPAQAGMAGCSAAFSRPWRDNARREMSVKSL